MNQIIQLSREDLRAELTDLFQEINENNTRDLIRTDEASEFLGISKKALYGLIHKGKLPKPHKRGKYLYFSKKSLRKWILTGEK